MLSITDMECVDWLKSHEIDALDDSDFPEMVGAYEVFFASPIEARAQLRLARDLINWISPFDTALFWCTDWPFYQPEEMAITKALRRGHNELRSLMEAPGHLFNWEEREELIGWVALMINFGWDSYVFPSPFSGEMFKTSHEDFLWVSTSAGEKLKAARNFPRKYGLQIHRETQIDQA
jgi:hypothetical protein